MLSIGEFSNICQVSTKTLRYYAEIGLILPDEINPENGYRYYSIEQLNNFVWLLFGTVFRIYQTEGMGGKGRICKQQRGF